MNPIRGYMGPERRKHSKIWLTIFWSVIFIAVVISSGSLIVANRATDVAHRSEKGFCIAISLIESGALADARVAHSPSTPRNIRKIRTEQYRGSIFFALQLRNQGFECQKPTNSVLKLIREVERNGR
jgi:hypothetical protein